MDDFEDILKASEKECARTSQALSKLLLDLWKNTSADLKQAIKKAHYLSWVAGIASVLSALAIAGCIYLGTVVHRQAGEIKAIAGEIKAIQDILESGVVIEDVTTTTETSTTVTQDSWEGSGNNVFQAGENSEYTQNGGGS